MYGLCVYQIDSCQPLTLMQLEIFSAGPFYNRPFLILSAASHRSPGSVCCQLGSNTDDNISPPSRPLWLITSINFSHRIQCRRMLTIIFYCFYNVTLELPPRAKGGRKRAAQFRVKSKKLFIKFLSRWSVISSSALHSPHTRPALRHPEIRSGARQMCGEWWRLASQRDIMVIITPPNKHI